MKNILLLTIALVVTNLIFAQDQDYGLTVDNDTIHGKATISWYLGANQQVTFKNKKSKKTVKVYELKSLTTKKGIFHTLKIKGKYQLAKLEKTGYLSLYMYSGNHTSINFDTPLLVKRTGEQMEISNIGFKKTTRKFLSDCHSVVQNFENDKYNKNKLTTVIDDYNQCIVDRTYAMQNRSAELAKRSNKVRKIIEIKNAIAKSEKIINKSVVLEMLGDIQTKLKNKDTIPNYLIEALKEQMIDEQNLLEELLSIIK